MKWKDGTVTWKYLKDLKELNPINVAEYVTARGIQGDPAFAWLLPFTFRKRDIIIAALKSRVRKSSHKYDIEIPTLVEHS